MLFRLIKLLDDNFERWLLFAFYSHVVAIVFIEVIRRFVFSYSSIWGEETARYAFIYLVWIGASAAIKDRSHIRIDIIFKFLSEKNKARLYIFTELTTLTFASVALYYSSIGVWETIKFDTLTSGLRVSQAWFTFAVPFGLTCLMVRVVQRIFLDISDIRNGRPVFTGQKMFS
jgi:TRAP-type C4-dicarboxylate transport system permease small subunit